MSLPPGYLPIKSKQNITPDTHRFSEQLQPTHQATQLGLLLMNIVSPAKEQLVLLLLVNGSLMKIQANTVLTLQQTAIPVLLAHQAGPILMILPGLSENLARG